MNQYAVRMNAGSYSLLLTKPMIDLQSGLRSLLELLNFAIQSCRFDNTLNVLFIA